MKMKKGNTTYQIDAYEKIKSYSVDELFDEYSQIGNCNLIIPSIEAAHKIAHITGLKHYKINRRSHGVFRGDCMFTSVQMKANEDNLLMREKKEAANAEIRLDLARKLPDEYSLYDIWDGRKKIGITMKVMPNDLKTQSSEFITIGDRESPLWLYRFKSRDGRLLRKKFQQEIGDSLIQFYMKSFDFELTEDLRKECRVIANTIANGLGLILDTRANILKQFYSLMYGTLMMGDKDVRVPMIVVDGKFISKFEPSHIGQLARKGYVAVGDLIFSLK